MLWLAYLLGTSLQRVVAAQLTLVNGSKYDYIILGGGTSGLVVANRLSEDPSVSVAVVEAGDSVRFNPNVTNTTQFGLSLGTSIDWAYTSLPQQYADNKSVVYHAGKALGGTSTINGMTYIRPQAAQIDLWQELGLTGWNWSSLFSYAKKSEHFQPPSPLLVSEGAAYLASAHGFSGPLDVSFNPDLTQGDVHELMNETWQELGIPYIPELNEGSLRGFTVWPQTLDSTADVREDAARAYYYPVENRTNLDVFLNTTANKLLWSDDSGESYESETVSGVEVQAADGTVYVLEAEKEVIVSLGSLRSPALLELSGIGNPSILSQFEIPVKVNLPSVGENLQDQINVFIEGISNQTFVGYPLFVTFATVNDIFGSDTDNAYQFALANLPVSAAQIAAQNNNATSASTQEYLLRTQLDLLFNQSVPALEILGVAETVGSTNIIGSPFWGLLPFSRGNVHITSVNASVPPAINPNFFMSEWDGVMQVASARLVRKSLYTPPLADVMSAEVAPGLTAVPMNASDEVWLEYQKSSCEWLWCLN